MFVPDDPQQFAHGNSLPDQPSGRLVVLPGSPPGVFRRLDRWTEEQDFDGDGIAVIVPTSSNDSVTLLDGKTGTPLDRTSQITSTSLNENGRVVDLNRPKLNWSGNSPHLLTRVDDGASLLGHLVSRAVLPPDHAGRYQRSRRIPDDNSQLPATSNMESSSIKD